MKKIDMTGYRVGKITVVSPAERRNRRTYWNCHCDCGRDTVIWAYSLKTGKTQSCGYCQGGRPSELEGQRFGRLTVLKLAETRKQSRYWLCQCDCGNTTVVRAGHLLGGKIRSCGCLTFHDRNEYRVEGNTVYVTMSGSKKGTMICDLDDWERLKDFVWNCSCGGYASTDNRKGLLKYKEFHRNVIEQVDGMFCDHINRNRLDNRKCNLRIVTPHQNTLNQSKLKNNKTGHLGITQRENCKYQARITLNGKTYNLGTYKTIEEAIEARRIGEEKLFQPMFEEGDRK